VLGKCFKGRIAVKIMNIMSAIKNHPHSSDAVVRGRNR
jgi:hypothetical protein